MAQRQYQLPGKGYVNETGRVQYPVPRYGYVDSTGPTTFSATISESIAASDSVSASATFAATENESLTASDSLSSVGTFVTSTGDSVVASDSLTSGAVYTAAFSESIKAISSVPPVTYSVPGKGIFNNTLSRQATVPRFGVVNDSTPVSDFIASAIFSPTQSESLVASDSLTALILYSFNITETIAADDSLATVASFVTAVSELITASDLPPGTTVAITSEFGDLEFGGIEFGGSDVSSPTTLTYPYAYAIFNTVTNEVLVAVDNIFLTITVPTGRVFIVPARTNLWNASSGYRSIAKTPAELDTFSLTYANNLSSDTILTSTWSATDSTLTTNSPVPVLNSPVAEVWLGGGTISAASAILTNNSVTSNQRDIASSIKVSVQKYNPIPTAIAIKSPQEVLDYGFDWTSRMLNNTDTVVTSSWSSSSPLELTAVSTTPFIVPPAKTFVLVSGGVAGKAYFVTNTVTTALGRTLEATFIVFMKQNIVD